MVYRLKALRKAQLLTLYRSPLTAHRLPLTSYRLLLTAHRLPLISKGRLPFSFHGLWSIVHGPHHGLSSMVHDLSHPPINLLSHGHMPVKPVDLKAFSFHSPEPGHLSFGKLMDGCVEFCYHFIIR